MATCSLRIVSGNLETSPTKFKTITTRTTQLHKEIADLTKDLKAATSNIQVSHVRELLEEVRDFNAGAIDAALDKHIDSVFAAWAHSHKFKVTMLKRRI